VHRPAAVVAPWWLLPLLVASQLFCCSVWFAAKAVLPELLAASGVAPGADELSSRVTFASARVEVGFVAGTLTVAGLSLADRLPPQAFVGWMIVDSLENTHENARIDGIYAA
jgi:hypothetical protein